MMQPRRAATEGVVHCKRGAPAFSKLRSREFSLHQPQWATNGRERRPVEVKAIPRYHPETLVKNAALPLVREVRKKCLSRA
jgi:hypothetical protein